MNKRKAVISLSVHEEKRLLVRKISVRMFISLIGKLDFHKNFYKYRFASTFLLSYA